MPYQEKRNGQPMGHWYGQVDLRNKGGQRWVRRFETRKAAKAHEMWITETGEPPPGMFDDGTPPPDVLPALGEAHQLLQTYEPPLWRA